MSASETESVIREVLAQHGHLAVDASQLSEESDLYEAGLTSHASVNVMLALEDAFDVEFPERVLRKSTFASIGSIREVVDELIVAVA
jgi:acyl carrier protein